jgi:hypothetical protein
MIVQRPSEIRIVRMRSLTAKDGADNYIVLIEIVPRIAHC